MSLFPLVLFVHLVALAVLFGAMGVAHVAVHQARSARHGPVALAWLGAFAGLRFVFPWGALVLALSGLELARETHALRHGWVVVSTVGLAAVVFVGLLVNASWGRASGWAVVRAGDGPLTDEARNALLAPGILVTLEWVAGTVLAILFLMVARPGPVASALIVAGGAAAGIAYGRWLAIAGRRPRTRPALVPERGGS